MGNSTRKTDIPPLYSHTVDLYDTFAKINKMLDGLPLNHSENVMIGEIYFNKLFKHINKPDPKLYEQAIPYEYEKVPGQKRKFYLTR